MDQQTVGESAEAHTFSEAIWQLPGQYIKVLYRPSAKTFNEEQGKASWSIVWLQFYLLILITIALSYLAHFIPTSALHALTALSIGSARPLAFLPPPYNGITVILASFFIGLGTAFLFSKSWHGQGTFLAHTYCLLLCTVPLVTISGLLLLFPSSGFLALLLLGLVGALFIYRMVLHGYIIMAVHGLSGGRAALIVLIIPMFIIGIAVLVGMLFLTDGGIFEALGQFDWGGNDKKH
jgi:hypothetical protein